MTACTHTLTIIHTKAEVKPIASDETERSKKIFLSLFKNNNNFDESQRFYFCCFLKSWQNWVHIIILMRNLHSLSLQEFQMIGFSTTLVCIMVGYVQAVNSNFDANLWIILRERNICWRLCFSTARVCMYEIVKICKAKTNVRHVTVPAKMFTRKVLCKPNGIKKCY